MEYLFIGCGAIYFAKRKKLIFKNTNFGFQNFAKRFAFLGVYL
jgi:hypothetical protein